MALQTAPETTSTCPSERERNSNVIYHGYSGFQTRVLLVALVDVVDEDDGTSSHESQLEQSAQQRELVLLLAPATTMTSFQDER